MDPVSAAIAAGGSILGGILGKPKNEYVVPSYGQIRRKAEAAGFNPLTALAMAPGQVVQSQNYMGSAIADAALSLADANAAKVKQNDPLEKLKRENELLKEKIINVTLRPKVPGVYGQSEAIPGIAQAVGGGNAKSVSSANGVGNGSGAVPDGGTGFSPLVGDQKLQVQDTPSSTGFMHLRNSLAPDGFYLPGSDGEPLDIWQLPVVLGSYAFDQFVRAWNKPADPPARYKPAYKMPPSETGRVIPSRQVHVNADSPAGDAAVRAKIKAVDPSYDDRPAPPSWYKYRVKPFGF